MNIRYLVVILLALFTATSCGYKPSVSYVKHIFYDSIYVKINIDMGEPENAPFVKDEMHRLIYSRFKSVVTSKELSKSSMVVSYMGSSFTPLAYRDGYVTRYRANIRTSFDMKTKDGQIKKNITSIVESDIQASSLASTALRTEAIRRGLEKSLDEFVAYISAKGALKERP